MEDIKSHDIKPIDMVVVNLYPFEETISRPGVRFEDAIENIDIGGPTMIRAAAKNYPYVSVVVDPADYSRILAEMEETAGMISEATN
jgi:phosphoribosylaminoimidazolecarboxamide formyltransferase/IMP cyclohydrolase